MNLNTQIILTKEDISHIIKEYLRENGYEVLGDVEFNISTELEGFLMGEREVTKFKNAIVNIKPNKESTGNVLKSELELKTKGEI